MENSGTPRPAGSKLARIRRISQILFLALFAFLLVNTELPRSARGAQTDIRIPYPIRLFLEIDPFTALSNALASGALYRGLLWSLAVVVPTLLLGRVFLRMDLPAGYFEPLRFLVQVGKEARQMAHRIEPL